VSTRYGNNVHEVDGIARYQEGVTRGSHLIAKGVATVLYRRWHADDRQCITVSSEKIGNKPCTYIQSIHIYKNNVKIMPYYDKFIPCS